MPQSCGRAREAALQSEKLNAKASCCSLCLASGLSFIHPLFILASAALGAAGVHSQFTTAEH